MNMVCRNNNHYFITAICVWTLVVITSSVWNIYQARKNAFELAQTQAVEDIRKNITFRRWASGHGGVYVRADQRTPPNAYLKVPDRDIEGPDGGLTLMNPAYMLRQIIEMSNDKAEINGHITSLQPINPSNAPDEWERKALESFEQGSAEAVTIADVSGKPFIRVMRPMLTEPSCLKCHADQGYQVGDVRGGISATVPLEPFLTKLSSFKDTILMTHGVAWLFGLLFIVFWHKKTEDWLFEREAREEHERLISNVFSFSHEGIIITDTHGICVDVNSTFSAITGYDHHEIVGKDPKFLGSDRHGPGFFHDIFKLVKSDGYWRGELWSKRKNGEVYPSLTTISAVKNNSGVCSHYVGTFLDISELKQQQSRLELMAYYDPLTKLPNRLLMLDRLSQAIEHNKRNKTFLLICFLDLDNFKAINDEFGHAIGDQLLLDFAGRIGKFVRGSDTVARIGGDEFVLIINDVGGIEECQSFLARLLTEISVPFKLDRNSKLITASVGATLFPDNLSDPEALIRHADHAMYEAKQLGGNCFQLFKLDNEKEARESAVALARIKAALSAEEFRLFYQPKVDLRNGEVIGVEALIRWLHPEEGLLSPAEFLPKIEGTKFEQEVGEWVIESAMKQLSLWEKININISISINISPNHLQSKKFMDKLSFVREKYGSNLLKRLEIEILETSALNDLINVSNIITQCHALGVNFSIDDFGTGYSSLSYLKRLPANTLKIDQDFVRTMLVNEEDKAIVRGVIGLAQAFHLNVIAEGVETMGHGTVLMGLGCPLVQGFGIARPMAADDVPSWIKSWNNEWCVNQMCCSI